MPKVESRGSGRGELALLYEAGPTWQEIRRPLPDGGESVVVELESPGLRFDGWGVVLLRTELRIVRVGTLGAAWVLFDATDGIQMWLSGQLEVPEGVIVQVEVGEGRIHP